jgi:uncharacterized protein YggE
MPPVKPQVQAPHLNILVVVAAFLLATAAGFGVFLFSSGHWQDVAQAKTITTVGIGQKTAGKLAAEIDFDIVITRQGNAQDALDEVNTKSGDIRAGLMELGVLPGDLTTERLRVAKQENAAIIQASQSFHLLMRDNTKLAAAQEMLKANGATIVSAPEQTQPTFAHARFRARQEAEEDAHARAAVIAQRDGKMLGRLVSSSAEEAVKDYSSSSPTAPRMREVTVHVTSVYEVQ